MIMKIPPYNVCVLGLCICSLTALDAFSAENKNLLDLDRNMKVEGGGTLENVEWHSPLDKPFSIYGLKWIGENQLYRRLPENRAGVAGVG